MLKLTKKIKGVVLTHGRAALDIRVIGLWPQVHSQLSKNSLCGVTLGTLDSQ